MGLDPLVRGGGAALKEPMAASGIANGPGGPSGRRPIRAIRRQAQGGPALEHFWTLLTAVR